MRTTWMLSGVVLAWFAGTACADAACYRPRLDHGRHPLICDTVRPRVIRFEAPRAIAPYDAEPIHIASAVLGGPPLIWSPTAAALIPPPYGSGLILGHTIPIEAVIGRRVLPIAITPPSVGYNSPTSAYGVVDRGIVLMRLPPPPHGAAAEVVY